MATTVADLLVRRGVPFREAHGIVAGLVRRALEQGRRLSELTASAATSSATSCFTGCGSTTRAARAGRPGVRRRD